MSFKINQKGELTTQLHAWSAVGADNKKPIKEEEAKSENTKGQTETLEKTISTQTFCKTWLIFMCNVAGLIHFYATFREIASGEMNIGKEDTLFILNVAFCDFFNATGKIFWAYITLFRAKGMLLASVKMLLILTAASNTLRDY